MVLEYGTKGDTLNLKTRCWIERIIIFFVFISISSLYLISCSGEPRSAADLVKKVVKAYGGIRGIDALERYKGDGFLKKLPIGKMVKNYPLSVFQNKYRYKECIARIDRGDAVDKWVWIDNGEGISKWTNSDKMLNKPLLENSFIKYRFPLIISLMHQSGAGWELIDNSGEGVSKLRFKDGDNVVTVTFDDKGWLLNRIEVNKSTDSLVYSEEYSTYCKVEGIPIPNRVTRSVNGKPYCEAFVPVIKYGVDLPDSVFMITAKDTLIEKAE
jgi:hypothetical protein